MRISWKTLLCLWNSSLFFAKYVIFAKYIIFAKYVIFAEYVIIFAKYVTS